MKHIFVAALVAAMGLGSSCLNAATTNAVAGSPSATTNQFVVLTNGLSALTNIALPQFNASLGTLTAVTVFFTNRTQVSNRVEVTTGTGVTNVFVATNRFQVAFSPLPSITNLSTLAFSNSFVLTDDNTTDFAGTGGTNFTSPIQYSTFTTNIAAGSISNFIGASNFLVAVQSFINTNSYIRPTGGGRASTREITVLSGISVGVIYTYTAIPEPATIAALMLTVPAFLSRRRRQTGV